MEAMNDDDINEMVGNCVFDTCVVGPDDSFSPVCVHADTLVQACLSDLGVVVKDWRTDDFCREIII